MRKYKNVDIIAALGVVVELNTEHYKSDFSYDIERFKKAAEQPGGENNRLLWMSRQSGTWCVPEREAYIKGCEAYHIWNGYATLLGPKDTYQTIIVSDRILAYAVEVKGLEQGRVIGNLYELDYREHIRQLQKVMLPLHSVTVKYEDGTEICLPFTEYDSNRHKLYHQHGKVLVFHVDPEDKYKLQDILNQVRQQREKEARPAMFKVAIRPKARKKATPELVR